LKGGEVKKEFQGKALVPKKGKIEALQEERDFRARLKKSTHQRGKKKGKDRKKRKKNLKKRGGKKDINPPTLPYLPAHTNKEAKKEKIQRVGGKTSKQGLRRTNWTQGR